MPETRIFILKHGTSGNYLLTLCVPADIQFIAELRRLSALAQVTLGTNNTELTLTLGDQVKVRRVEILLGPIVGALITRASKHNSRKVKMTLSRAEISKASITLPQGQTPDSLLTTALKDDPDITVINQTGNNVVRIQVNPQSDWNAVQGRVRQYLTFYALRRT